MSLEEEKKAESATPEKEAKTATDDSITCDTLADSTELNEKKDDMTTESTTLAGTAGNDDPEVVAPIAADTETKGETPPSADQSESASTTEAAKPEESTTEARKAEDSTPEVPTPEATPALDDTLADDESNNNPQSAAAEDVGTAIVSSGPGTVGLYEGGLKHAFVPGDHVIRWEMLPIVWPIQIHGIVLETSKDYVSICDFGLTAEPRHDLKETEQQAAAAAEEEAKEETKDEKINTNKKLLAAWDRVKPPDNTKKERITVHIITTQDELKAWKKVNYGQGLFGTGPQDDGSNPDHNQNGAADTQQQQSQQQASSEENPRPRTRVGQRVGQWWQNAKQRRQQGKQQQQQQGKDQQQQLPPPDSNDNTENTAMDADNPDAATFAGNASMSTLITSSDTFDGGDDANKQATLKHSKSDPELASSNGTVQATTAEEAKPAAAAVPARRRIFARLRRHKSRSTSPSKNDNANKLPKSDPPKLVLARTRFLLQYGEKVLPPYHPFKANSECIAVFCKTGRWSTLQASVFLHSTAIGNAKSSMAMTLGVAASVPLLAPAIAGIGLVAVGAPYVILNQSREFWQQETIRLNELVWAQAEPEVFVECIERWSNIGKKKEEKKDGDDNSNTNDESNAEDSTRQDGSEKDTAEEEQNGAKDEHRETPETAEKVMDSSAKSATAPHKTTTTKTRPKERFVSV
ncbi:expressed unknown protein [Seminavis robusta]|uniref:Uncharacterized protein n=1 Tax=Seminavis robusta TaxID=568900 RepID=A0A9N8E090_9STRA|nr:expressed unknown protein [Seminavis robusta]|eukprot:Sro407_g136680.1 n/a (692) ;mRNA; f:40500-42575